MISIIIPAHNEGAVIARTLSTLLEGAAPDEFDIVVVCNGCSDDTAVQACRFGPAIRVLETEVAGKPHALNLGDQAARAFPRIYMDADVVVTVHVLRALAKRLAMGDVLAVAPQAKLDLTDCSRPVSAFYAVRRLLPSIREGIGGSGIYALSEAGRQRFELFPTLTSDDGFVRVQFQPQERETLTGVTSTVYPPRNLRALIATRARVDYGSLELARRFPSLWARRGEGNLSTLIQLSRNPRMWGKLVIYFLVTLAARRQATLRLDRGPMQWHQDSSSRIRT
jgi:glycosyltransferase involved in cell wall biosynthesis